MGGRAGEDNAQDGLRKHLVEETADGCEQRACTEKTKIKNHSLPSLENV
jgi:hypothetical protein